MKLRCTRYDDQQAVPDAAVEEDHAAMRGSGEARQFPHTFNRITHGWYYVPMIFLFLTLQYTSSVTTPDMADMVKHLDLYECLTRVLYGT